MADPVITEEGNVRIDLIGGPFGPMLARRMARIAGVSVATVKREMKAYQRSSAVPAEDNPVIIDPSKGNQAEDIVDRVARQCVEHFGLGRVGARARAAASVAEQERKKEEELAKTVGAHPWSVGIGGRSIRSQPGGSFIATLTCQEAGCDGYQDIRFRQLAGSDQIDQKFKQKGWKLDPMKCPQHQRKAAPQMTTSSTAPSPAAIKAQAKMFNLLAVNFDPETGAYAKDWNDAAVAKECGLSAETIAAFRTEAFGELKEPPEIAALAGDIAALEQLATETMATLHRDLNQLKARLSEVRRKYA